MSPSAGEGGESFAGHLFFFAFLLRQGGKKSLRYELSLAASGTGAKRGRKLFYNSVTVICHKWKKPNVGLRKEKKYSSLPRLPSPAPSEGKKKKKVGKGRFARSPFHF